MSDKLSAVDLRAAEAVAAAFVRLTERGYPLGGKCPPMPLIRAVVEDVWDEANTTKDGKK